MDMMSKIILFVLMAVVRVVVCGGIIATAGVAVFVVLFNVGTFFGEVVAKTMVDPTGLIMFVSITAVVAVMATVAVATTTTKTA